jgi:hypothetical protein
MHIDASGILNVHQYEDETLHFAGGRLLLRGVNGSGTSTAMNMLLPFLLEADTRKIPGHRRTARRAGHRCRLHHARRLPGGDRSPGLRRRRPLRLPRTAAPCPQSTSRGPDGRRPSPPVAGSSAAGARRGRRRRRPALENLEGHRHDITASSKTDRALAACSTPTGTTPDVSSSPRPRGGQGTPPPSAARTAARSVPRPRGSAAAGRGAARPAAR